ncbi:MAG: hypothetical protein NVS4B1_18010 [Ktedonobacteraceae bacterium]
MLLVILDYIYLDAITDYYALLGVAVDAPTGDIKAAFKKLALQYHPDVYKGEDAHERMRVLLQAYQTLNDPNARRDYDQRRTAHTLHTVPNGVTHVPHTARPFARTASDISPSARRDRQRHYDFPILQDKRVTHVDLIDISYALSPNEAYILRHEGLLRGVAPETHDHSYYCHRCHHHWRPAQNGTLGSPLPLFCPKCQASDWTEYLLLRCVHCTAVFESEQIRYEVGIHTYYGKAGNKAGLCPPYELFPLCPYCNTARWCPTEDTRVGALRQRQAKRDAMMRMIWISVTLFIIIILGVLALNVMR